MIAVIGCGTLGSRVAAHLSEQEATFFDHDKVEEKNLAYQKYTDKEVGLYKAEVLANRNQNHSAKTAFIDDANILLLAKAEVVLDCTDNLASRKRIGKYCSEQGICLIHAAAAGTRGIVARLTNKPSLQQLYHQKIAMEDCKSSEINLRTAERIATLQARLAQDAIHGDESTALFLVYPDAQEEVKLGPINKKAEQEEIEITYCTRRECFKIQLQDKQEPIAGEIEGVAYLITSQGEALFPKTQSVDNILKAAKKLLDRQR